MLLGSDFATVVISYSKVQWIHKDNQKPISQTVGRGVHDNSNEQAPFLV